MISVLVLTLNEEQCLPACLESVAWSDDVVVFDSMSSDRTCEIARSTGARVFQREFDNFASQRNAALTRVRFCNDWVLMLDADEQVPQDLAAEMERAVRTASDDVVMFRMRRKDFLYGKWLKRANAYPTWFGRLVLPARVIVEREINEQFLADGKVLELSGHLYHHSYRAGFHRWIETQNRHSTMEADLLVQEEKKVAVINAGYFSSDPVKRRQVIKKLAMVLPGRPIVVFVYWYLFRLGFLEGRAGFTHCVLRAFYEYMIDLKVDELQRGIGPDKEHI